MIIQNNRGINQVNHVQPSARNSGSSSFPKGGAIADPTQASTSGIKLSVHKPQATVASEKLNLAEKYTSKSYKIKITEIINTLRKNPSIFIEKAKAHANLKIEQVKKENGFDSYTKIKTQKIETALNELLVNIENKVSDMENNTLHQLKMVDEEVMAKKLGISKMKGAQDLATKAVDKTQKEIIKNTQKNTTMTQYEKMNYFEEKSNHQFPNDKFCKLTSAVAQNISREITSDYVNPEKIVLDLLLDVDAVDTDPSKHRGHQKNLLSSSYSSIEIGIAAAGPSLGNPETLLCVFMNFYGNPIGKKGQQVFSEGEAAYTANQAS